MDQLKRILCVCRMPGTCGKTFACAASLSRRYGAGLCVIHVIHNPFSLEGWNLPVPRAFIEEEYNKILSDARTKMDALINDERGKGLAVRELLREGNPTDEILRTTALEDIDLLILPAHRDGRLEHFLFGRSNEEIIRKMPCSILLVKDEPGPAAF